MRSLLRKDLTLQAPALLLGVGAAFMALILIQGERLLAGGRVAFVPGALEQGLADFVLYALTPLAVLVSRQLIVPELRDGGIGILRTLPTGTGRALLAKLIVAATVSIALVASALALTTSLIRLWEPPDARLLASLTSSSLAWLAWVSALAVAWASAGRHRFAVLLGGALAFQAIELPASLEAPWRLLRTGFLIAEPDDVTGTVSQAGGLLCLALIWWSARSGTWLEACSGKLRAGDGWRIVALATGVALVYAPAPRAPALLGGDLVELDGVTVRVPSPDSRAEAQAMAEEATSVLGELPQRLQLEPPRLAIEHGRGGDPQRASGVAGLLVRLDVTAPLDRGWLLANALDEATAGRLRASPSRVLLDGLPGWLDEAPTPSAQLRVAWGLEQLSSESVGAQLLGDWAAVRSRLGDPVACSLAGWVLNQLEQLSTHAAIWELVRAACQDPERPFLRAATSLGLTEGALTAALDRRAQALLARHTSTLAALPQAPSPGEVRPEASEGRIRLVFSGPGRTLLLHTLAGDDPAPPSYQRDEGDSRQGVLYTDARYPPGASLQVAFATWIPELGCEVVAGWQELRLP